MKNRAQRRFNAYNKYKNRLKKWMPFYEHWNLKNGVRSWKDFEKEEYSKFLKDTPTPCSCYICRGEEYDRKNFKHNTEKEIQNGLLESEDE